MSITHPTRTAPTIPTRHRANGWTPARQQSFLDALARDGSVVAACRTVGLSTQSAYALRTRAKSPDGANPFATAWDDAVETARATRQDMVDDAAFTRAIHGWVEPVWYKGEQVGERTRHDARLLMKLLELRDRADARAERAEREAERRRADAESQAEAEREADRRARIAAAIRMAPAPATHPLKEALLPPSATEPLTVRPGAGPRATPIPRVPSPGARLSVTPPPTPPTPPHAHHGHSVNFINLRP